MSATNLLILLGAGFGAYLIFTRSQRPSSSKDLTRVASGGRKQRNVDTPTGSGLGTGVFTTTS